MSISTISLEDHGYYRNGGRSGVAQFARNAREIGRMGISAEILWGEEPDMSPTVCPLLCICGPTLDAGKMRHMIGLVWTTCFFGGQRFWFVCPACFRRIGILYLVGSNLEGCSG